MLGLAEEALGVEVLKNELAGFGGIGGFGVGHEADFGDFGAGGEFTGEVGGVAGETDDGAGGLVVSGCFEDAVGADGVGNDIYRKLFFDFADEGLLVGLAGLALAAGVEPGGLIVVASHEELLIGEVNEDEFVDEEG